MVRQTGTGRREVGPLQHPLLAGTKNAFIYLLKKENLPMSDADAGVSFRKQGTWLSKN